MSNNETKEKLKAPCGCEFWKEGLMFYVKPCSLDCPNYLYAIEESKKRENWILSKCMICGLTLSTDEEVLVHIKEVHKR